jgi:hypothetical protein
MNIQMRRLPIYLFVIGAIFKAVLVVLWRLYQPAEIYGLLIKYDPIGNWGAYNVTSLLFGHRRVVLKMSEGLFFEIILVIAFAIECFILGLILQMAIRKISKRYDATLKPSAS